MGTRKKVLLASLVGVAMILAFVLGAMPGFDQSRLAASSDQVNIQDVLDALLGNQDKGQGLTVNSAVQAVIVKTPAGDSYITPEIPLPLTLSQSVGNVPVRYVASVKGDNTVWSASANPNNPGGAGTWTGNAHSAFTDPAVFSAPYSATLDAGVFVTGVASSRTIFLYGLVNAALSGAKAASITYSSATIDPYSIDITELDGGVVDVDANGIPDAPEGIVGQQQIWTAKVDDGNGNSHTVLVVNLNTSVKGGTQVFSSPADGITIEAPTTADLIAANAIPSGTTALLVVKVADDLANLLDDEAVEPGSESFTTAAGWASAVKGLAPVSARSIAGPIVDVSIVLSDGTELETLPDTLPVTISLANLTVGTGEELSLFSYPTVAAQGTSGLVLGNAPGLQNWTLVESGVGSGTLSVDVTHLSAFVPFLLPAFNVTSVSPTTANEGEQVALTLSGTIPTATALSIAEAEASYAVTVNGTPATFRNGDSGNAIDAYVAKATTNSMYLYWTAAVSTKATQVADIQISKIVSGTPVLLQNITNAITITPTYSVTVNAGAGGTAVAATPSNGPGGSYTDGTDVEIIATPNAGFEFLTWSGLTGDEANVAETHITANADRVVTATFQAISVNKFTLNITRGGNGTGTVTPGTPLQVDAGTVVTIVATPGSGSKFTGWTGNTAGVANVAAADTTVTVNANTNLVANFAKKSAEDEPLAVIGVDAQGGVNDDGQVEVWLFGGEVIRLNGSGLVAGNGLVSFQVGSNPAVNADLYNVAPDGSFGLVVVPPTNDSSNEAFVLADLKVTRASDNATFDFGNAIRYRRYNTNAENVTTTAFILDTPATGGSVQVSTGAGNSNFATLTLPGLDNAGTNNVYGLVRTGVVDAAGKNTAPISGPVGTGQIGDGIASAFGGAIPGTTPAATELPGTLDVAFYLYSGAPSDKAGENTGTVGASAFTPSNELLNFNRGATGEGNDLPTPGDASGNAGNAASFSVALADGVLTHGDVRHGLTVWGVETQYDYVTDTIQAVDNAKVAFQSEILSNQVTPSVVGEKANTPDSTVVDTISMRLYSLNGFSLRQNVVAPPEVAAGVRLNTASGTASGSINGGTALTVVSPAGGIGWVAKADFVVGGTVVGTVSDFTSDRGADEYVLQLNAPKFSKAGIADIVLTGRANTTALEAINLKQAFEIKAAPQGFPYILLLLGLLAALLGLAAGGSSGGGGGGPCFIATAAYGTPLAGDIDTLRDVRDEYMLTNAVGTAFTDTYYRIAPTIADSVATSPVLAASVRVLLVPVIFLGKMALTSPALMLLAAMSIGFFFFSKRKSAKQS